MICAKFSCDSVVYIWIITNWYLGYFILGWPKSLVKCSPADLCVWYCRGGGFLCLPSAGGQEEWLEVPGIRGRWHQPQLCTPECQQEQLTRQHYRWNYLININIKSSLMPGVVNFVSLFLVLTILCRIKKNVTISVSLFFYWILEKKIL